MPVKQSFQAGALLFVSIATPAIAAEQFPFSYMPTSLPGLSTGWLQPEATNTAELGTRQTGAPDGGGTGTQVYDWSLGFRGYWPLQVGLSFHVFDDIPNRPLLGSAAKITFGSASIDAKYALYDQDRLAIALAGSLGYMGYRNGFDVSETFFGGTLSVPVSYQLTPSLTAHGELGLTGLPKEVAKQEGFGNRAFAALGMNWQASNRITVYGSAKALFRETDEGIEGDENTLYTLGARAALTPQVAATVFATNVYSDSPILDDVAFFPGQGDTTFGAALTYVPSNKRFNMARYGAVEVAAADRNLIFGDGITMMGPATIGSNDVRISLSYGSSDNPALSFYISPDPDFQIEFTFEDYALEDGNAFRTPVAEDTRYSAGVRYQALSEDEGDPFSFGARLALGRDIEKPTAGVAYAEASARKRLAQGVNITVAPRAAVEGGSQFYAAGLSVDWTPAKDIKLTGEYSLTGGDTAENIWAFGVQRSFPKSISSIDIFATNAAGRSGVGSMLSGEPQVGVMLTWQPPFGLF